jgi:hypothetical protein
MPAVSFRSGQLVRTEIQKLMVFSSDVKVRFILLPIIPEAGILIVG